MTGRHREATREEWARTTFAALEFQAPSNAEFGRRTENIARLVRMLSVVLAKNDKQLEQAARRDQAVMLDLLDRFDTLADEMEHDAEVLRTGALRLGVVLTRIEAEGAS